MYHCPGMFVFMAVEQYLHSNMLTMHLTCILQYKQLTSLIN